MSAKPTILFLCIHNAGRSQMAAGFAREYGGESVDVLTGGSAPRDSVNPVAVEAMAEKGIDIAAAQPRKFDDADVDMADVVVTMGCGDTCPYVPGKRYLDWEVDDPAGQPIEEVRRIRDDIESRVKALLDELQRR